MTLDEARVILGLTRGASHTAVRDAFRRRARQVHPDSHPTASAAQREGLAREFDLAREARDILLLLPDAATTAGTPFPPPPGTPPRPASPTTATPPTSPVPPRERPSPPLQRTLRFDEFVQVVDAAGFGPGHRTKPHRDIPRLLVWSTVGAVCTGVLVSVVWMAVAS